MTRSHLEEAWWAGRRSVQDIDPATATGPQLQARCAADVEAVLVKLERAHAWQSYMNGTFCTRCGAALGSGMPCR